MDYKKIFAMRNSDISKIKDVEAVRTESRQDGETYKQYGFRMAGISQGGLQAFTPCIQSVYLGLKKEQEADDVLQQSLKVDLQNKKASKETEKEKEENNLLAFKEKQQSLEGELDEKRQELVQVRSETYRRNRSAWITLIISGVILIPFTLYFFIFYSSVGYSAFFKEFTLNAIAESGDFKLAEAIFDSQALSSAMTEGFVALLFILLMPVIFLAFGFILNRWEKEKGWFKWVKIPLIIIAAFIFDALLSYEICEKIYNLHTQMSLEALPDYSFSLASKDPKFWIIICLGFVSYLIWGITFGYFVKSLDQLDLNRILQEQLQNDINVIREKISESQDKQRETANKIADLKSEIQKLENQINGTVARYDVNKIKLELNNFHAGWQQYLAGMNKQDEEKNAITDEFGRTINTLITI
ncbi:MAG: hypothetical protein IJK42_00200 [Prevotella sp.]|nr:hypothetical protein [Prevotella sp.]